MAIEIEQRVPLRNERPENVDEEKIKGEVVNSLAQKGLVPFNKENGDDTSIAIKIVRNAMTKIEPDSLDYPYGFYLNKGLIAEILINAIADFKKSQIESKLSD